MEGDTVYVDKQLVIERAQSHEWLNVTGAIDYFNAAAAARAVADELGAPHDGPAGRGDASQGNGDLHLDLTGLQFADITGIRALVRVAKSASNGRRLVLHGLPPQIQKVMTVVGWADLPNLVIEEP
jgi:hypothetical protein